jgi:hypothetical protein
MKVYYFGFPSSIREIFFRFLWKCQGNINLLFAKRRMCFVPTLRLSFIFWVSPISLNSCRLFISPRKPTTESRNRKSSWFSYTIPFRLQIFRVTVEKTKRNNPFANGTLQFREKSIATVKKNCCRKTEWFKKIHVNTQLGSRVKLSNVSVANKGKENDTLPAK